MADSEPELGPARPPDSYDGGGDLRRPESPFSLDRRLLRELSVPEHMPAPHAIGVPDPSLVAVVAPRSQEGPSPAPPTATAATTLTNLLDAKRGKAGFDSPDQVHINHRLANDRQHLNPGRRLDRLVADVFADAGRGLHAYGSNLADVWRLDDVLANIYLPDNHADDNDRFVAAGKLTNQQSQAIVVPDRAQRKTRWDQPGRESDLDRQTEHRQRASETVRPAPIDRRHGHHRPDRDRLPRRDNRDDRHGRQDRRRDDRSEQHHPHRDDRRYRDRDRDRDRDRHSRARC
ncbi:hypothetical protein V1517DRAFT_316785 [Lipomyces orientalis]|uniref:Uncharacterized protein n=1 Tax=Lipomyces orientalis TaxID=1233043 RepID=A0ACC3TTJ6_9ASCO